MSEPSIAPAPDKGFLAKTWAFISRPSARFSLGGLMVLGGVLGVLFWGGFNWALELTNKEAFCISRHEMRNIPYAELQNTIHFKIGPAFARRARTATFPRSGFTR